MKVEQISVFLENKLGRLAEVTSALGNNGVNIRALTIADTSDFGILRLIVSDIDRASEVLSARGFVVNRTEVVAVEVPDKPGGLSQVLQLLQQKDINVEYLYAFIERSSNNAVIVFRFDDNDSAIKILSSQGIAILDGSKVYSL
jgi:hypothetical protein